MLRVSLLDTLRDTDTVLLLFAVTVSVVIILVLVLLTCVGKKNRTVKKATSSRHSVVIEAQADEGTAITSGRVDAAQVEFADDNQYDHIGPSATIVRSVQRLSRGGDAADIFGGGVRNSRPQREGGYETLPADDAMYSCIADVMPARNSGPRMSDGNSLYAQIRDPAADQSSPSSSQPRARVDSRGRKAIPVPIPNVPVDSGGGTPIYSEIGKRNSAREEAGGGIGGMQRGVGSGVGAREERMKESESLKVDKVLKSAMDEIPIYSVVNKNRNKLSENNNVISKPVKSPDKNTIALLQSSPRVNSLNKNRKNNVTKTKLEGSYEALPDLEAEDPPPQPTIPPPLIKRSPKKSTTIPVVNGSDVVSKSSSLRDVNSSLKPGSTKTSSSLRGMGAALAEEGRMAGSRRSKNLEEEQGRENEVIDSAGRSNSWSACHFIPMPNPPVTLAPVWTTTPV